jgi:Tol biopolymer transport system component
MVRLNLSTLQADTLFWVPERVQAVALAGAGRLVFDAHSTLENLRESLIDDEGEGRPGAPEREARWLTRGRSNDRQPVYSSDGEWVAFSSDRSGNLDLWRVSTKTGTSQQLTNDAADDWDPAFTRDGKKLVWSSNRSGAFEIWIAAADGSGARQLTHDGVDAENPTATPDGQWIVYSSGNPKHPGIWKIRSDGSQATRLVAGTTVWPEVSPDGRYVVYRNAAYDWPNSRMRDISMRVVQIADGTLVPFEIKLKSGLSAGRARWLPGGRGLAFIGSTENGINGVFVQDFAADGDTTATRRRLAGFSSRAASESFSIAPDGTRITLAEREGLSSLMVADRLPGPSTAR